MSSVASFGAASLLCLAGAVIGQPDQRLQPRQSPPAVLVGRGPEALDDRRAGVALAVNARCGQLGAGVRHLFMDFSHDLVSKEKGKSTSLVVVVISTILTIAFAAKLFGAF